MMTILSFTGGYIITVLIKNLVLRLRPEDALILETGYSFPSGHAIAATIFFVLFCYFYIINIRSLILRECLIVLSVLLVALTAFSRVYLGVHWLSDVLAGIGFGLFWSTLCILLVKYVGMIVKRIKEENRGELLQ
jgi:undecaprenyl-diphosphatase